MKGITMNRTKKYGIGSLLFDTAMCCLTGGIWFIRIFVREMRNR